MKEADVNVDVLVTGATGSLGVQVSAELRRRGLTVCATGRERVSADVVWDVTTTNGPQASVRPHTIVHAAARRASLDDKKRDDVLWNINVGGTARVVEWALSNGVKRLIVISGAVVYGDWSVPRTEDDEPQPASGYYALSKWAAERIAMTACTGRCELTVLRLSSLFGASFKTGLIRHFLSQAKTHGVIRIDPPIEDGFDLLHVSDAASTIASAVQYAATGLWNVGGGEIVSLTRLAQECASAMGVTVEHSRRKARRKARILNWVDDTRARTALGHANKRILVETIREIVSLEDAMPQTPIR